MSSLFLLRGSTLGVFLASSYILLVGKTVPRGVKVCWCGVRWDHAITLKRQVQNARVMVHKDADSQLCGGNRYNTNTNARTDPKTKKQNTFLKNVLFQLMPALSVDTLFPLYLSFSLKKNDSELEGGLLM
ncbi:hypothetical protein TNCV_4705311 [Trichonephila clavipes]|nr:hypothetical protein TNCV_4705311 [Trichonephila clavipes]